MANKRKRRQQRKLLSFEMANDRFSSIGGCCGRFVPKNESDSLQENESDSLQENEYEHISWHGFDQEENSVTDAYDEDMNFQNMREKKN